MNILIALDQFVFALVSLGKSRPDETISAAAWRWRLAGHWRGRWLVPVIDGLFWLLFGQEDHCKSGYESELTGAHLPSHYHKR